jgi:DNA polymerase-3 subunit gamma/tau
LDRQQLALKYRPRTWTDVVGQDHSVGVLVNSILQDRIHASYIFKGTAGSGKTSAARIMAMALNCEHLTGANPCLECISCTEALRERNPDIIEIDGASHGGVDHVRDLKNSAIYSPHHRRKVYIIDEVHALSPSAFQALLKLLEEPPSHANFILATTNPEKIPGTILSRSITLDFKRHTEKAVVDRLIYIAAREDIDLDTGAGQLIARVADGGLRDAVTTLDQLAVSHPGKKIEPRLVAKALGIISGTELHQIMRAVAEHDALALEDAVGSVLERTTEFSSLTRAITDWYRDVLRIKAGAGEKVRRSENDRTLLDAFARSHSFQHIDNAIQITWQMADRVRAASSYPKTFFLAGLYKLMLLTGQEPFAPPAPPERQSDLPRPTAPDVPVTFTGPAITDLEAELRKLA